MNAGSHRHGFHNSRAGRLARRKLLGAVTGGVAGMGAIGLAGCGTSGNRRMSGSTAAKAAATAGQPERGGYLRHLVAYSASNLDPDLTDDSTGYGFTIGDWYEPLVHIDYTPTPDWRIANKVVPGLADRIEQVDPVTYTFGMRRGVTFHNGDGLTARDVLFSYKRVQDPATKTIPVVRSYFANLDRVEAPDDFTIRVTSKRPDADFLQSLASRLLAILSQSYVENGGDLTKAAVGTGPFKLTSYQRDGNAQATRFERYWLPGRPYLDGISMVLKVDDAAAGAAFTIGDADILIRHDRKEAEPILKANPKVAAEKFANEAIYGIVFNQSKPPFSDVRVRQALHLALDRQAADKAVNFGDGVISGPLVLAGKPGWGIPADELMKLPGFRQPKEQDVVEAKRLLAAAGYGGGLKTSIGFPSTSASAPAYAEVVQAQIKQLGIDAALLPADNATFTQRRVKPDFDMMLALEGNLASPGSAAYLCYYSTGVYGKPSGIDDPDLDRLIDAQAVEFDYGKRGAIFQQIERRILDQMYKAPISSPTLFHLSQPWVHDWVDNRGAHQSIMNPEAIWMSLNQAPQNRSRP